MARYKWGSPHEWLSDKIDALHAEKTTLLTTADQIAAREFKRGLEIGLGIAEISAGWMRMTRVGGRPRKTPKLSYTQIEVADMVDVRVAEERKRYL